jgi:hypothetical protein
MFTYVIVRADDKIQRIKRRELCQLLQLLYVEIVLCISLLQLSTYVLILYTLIPT